MTQATKTTKATKSYDVPKLLEEYETKSAVIRYLASEGIKRADIARMMGIRYQHVRNVLTYEMKGSKES